MGLALPLLGSAVPNEIRLDRHTASGGAPVMVTKALLERKLLIENDWQGSFSITVQKGLERWLNGPMGCNDLKVLGALRITFTDNILSKIDVSIDRDDYDDEENEEISEIRETSREKMMQAWSHEYGGDPRGSLAAFGVQVPGYEIEPIWIQVAVNRIERHFPGLGFSLIGLLDSAFTQTIGGHGFTWALQEVEWNSEDWKHKPGDKPSGYPYGNANAEYDETIISEDNFYKYLPKETCNQSWKLGRIRRALKIAMGTPAMTKIRPLLAAAVELAVSVNECRKRFRRYCHTGLMMVDYNNQMHPKSAVYLKWDEDDLQDRIVDSHYYEVMNESVVSSFTWFYTFQPGYEGGGGKQENPDGTPIRTSEDQGTLNSAITALELAVHQMKALDTVLHLMNGPHICEQKDASERKRRTRERNAMIAAGHRTTLMEVMLEDAEEDAEEEPTRAYAF